MANYTLWKGMEQLQGCTKGNRSKKLYNVYSFRENIFSPKCLKDIGAPADKRDLTTLCSKFSNTCLKSVKITMFYCHSKRIHSRVMHSGISYILNLHLFSAKIA